MGKTQVSGSFRADVRKKLADLEGAGFVGAAKKFGVNPAKYKGMANAGLARMNVINSVVGAAVRMVEKDGKSEKTVLALCK